MYNQIGGRYGNGECLHRVAARGPLCIAKRAERFCAMRVAAAVKWYEMKTVSQAKAAEIAGLSRAEFLDALGRFGVSPFQYDSDELIKESGHA